MYIFRTPLDEILEGPKRREIIRHAKPFGHIFVSHFAADSAQPVRHKSRANNVYIVNLINYSTFTSCTSIDRCNMLKPPKEHVLLVF